MFCSRRKFSIEFQFVFFFFFFLFFFCFFFFFFSLFLILFFIYDKKISLPYQYADFQMESLSRE